MDTFRDALLAAYRERPCQVLPNALWKTLAEIPNYTCTFAVDNGHTLDCHSPRLTHNAQRAPRVTHLQMLRDDALLLYWNRERRPPDFSATMWASMNFALLHADFATATPAAASREAYFRLRHNLDTVPNVVLPPGYRFTSAGIAREATAIAGFIAQCYDNVAPDAGAVRTWSRRPVHDPRLAFWIVDTTQDRPAALALSDFDAHVPEVSLEWIQVHPDYRRRGLGTALVQETLSRARGRAAFATVSGQIHNPTNPQGLYRRCGFHGDDVWYVLRR